MGEGVAEGVGGGHEALVVAALAEEHADGHESCQGDGEDRRDGVDPQAVALHHAEAYYIQDKEDGHGMDEEGQGFGQDERGPVEDFEFRILRSELGEGVEHRGEEHELEGLGDAVEEGGAEAEEGEHHDGGDAGLAQHVGRQEEASVGQHDEAGGVGHDEPPQGDVELDEQPREQLREHHREAVVVDEDGLVVDVVEELVGGVDEQDALLGEPDGEEGEKGEGDMACDEVGTMVGFVHGDGTKV